MSLVDTLLSHRPRETSGSSSANRFEFQRTWALCHLLKLHESDRRYVLILEYHDDVLVLDDDVDPQTADFFQVKTRKDGHWSKRDLIRATKAPVMKTKKVGSQSLIKAEQVAAIPRSILGKLLEHCRHFLPQVGTLNLVSNVTFNLPLTKDPTSTSRDMFCLGDLNDEALLEVKEAIKKELGIAEELPWDKVYLLATGISLTEHEKYGVGELAAFLDRRHPGGRFPVQPLFRTLCGEIARRTTNEWHPVSFDELCQKKGVRRADLEAFLRVEVSRTDMAEQLLAVKTQLTQEGASYREVRDVESAWRRYDIDRIDQTNMTVQKFKEYVVTVLTQGISSTSWETLREFLALVQVLFVRLYGLPDLPFDMRYLQGAILYEFKNHEVRQLSPANP